MLDIRYPALRSIEDIPYMSRVDRRRLRTDCRSIYHRTDFRCAYHAVQQCLFFYLGADFDGAALPGDLVRIDDGQLPRTKAGDLPWVDMVCYALQTGRIPASIKDREMAYAEKAAKSDAESAENRKMDVIEKDIASRLRFNRNRVGMHRNFRPSAVVDGLKGG